MQTLNLSDLNSSDIKYKISQFPDGQQQVEILDWNITTSATIASRFNSFKDLELIICATKSLRRVGITNINLYIPYLLGARSDRQFNNRSNSYLVEVIAPIINSLNFAKVSVLDVHSDVAAACINNLELISNYELVHYALDTIRANTTSAYKTRQEFSNADCILVSPDAGAMKKIYSLVQTIGYNGEIVIANKHRDIVTGNILSTEVPISDSNVYDYVKNYVIIDDICDGGRTFIEIAKKLKETLLERNGVFTSKIYLIVTHGIFSAGFSELNKYFDKIFCTNSIKDVDKYSEYNLNQNKITQFKVI